MSLRAASCAIDPVVIPDFFQKFSGRPFVYPVVLAKFSRGGPLAARHIGRGKRILPAPVSIQEYKFLLAGSVKLHAASRPWTVFGHGGHILRDRRPVDRKALVASSSILLIPASSSLPEYTHVTEPSFSTWIIPRSGAALLVTESAS